MGRAVPPKLENDCVVCVFQEYMVSFTYPLPAARYGFRGGFSACVQFAAGLGLAAAIVIATVTPSWAQKAGGGKRTARVEIAEVKTQILSNFTEVQGRVTVGLVDSVTAVTNATTQLGEFRLGDQVVPGDIVAEVGAGGRATGPHLDWRMNWMQQRIDPQLLVPPMPAQ